MVVIGKSTRLASVKALLLAAALSTQGLAQEMALSRGISSCSEIVSPHDAERCIVADTHAAPIPNLVPGHIYALPELIDIAESANPEGRIAWAEAKTALERAGIDSSYYLPLLTLVTEASDSRFIDPFPEPIAPRGYVTVETPTALAQLQLQYSLLNFKRGPELDSSKALEVAATLRLARVHQTIAYKTAMQFYETQRAVAQLEAAQTILETAQTLRSNAQAQFDNGRATLPDVQNAEAGSAEARYDLADAEGEVKKQKLALTEAIGVEPTADIEISPQDSSAPKAFDDSVNEFIESAKKTRPDLAAYLQDVKHSHDLYRAAHSAYLPKIDLSATGGRTSIWASADWGIVGPAGVSTWSVSAEMKWDIFNAARHHEVAESLAEEKAAVEEHRAAEDAVTRQVWGAYVDYQTALEQERASQSFLSSAQTSYDSSLDAFGYGVRSLVDVVQAEKQLAQARLEAVRARARRLESEVELSYSTGDLLSGRTKAGNHP
jgi:outer membrane protein